MIGPNGENLTFLLGLPRSGTTLLSVMLAKHPAVASPPEPWLMLALESLGKVSDRHPADSRVLGGALREFLGDAGAKQLTRAAAVEAYNQKLTGAGRSVFLDKTPRYYFILPYLRELLPDAKFIWLLRNPLAVAASYITTWQIDLPSLLKANVDSWAYYDLIIGPRRLIQFSKETDGLPYWIRYEELVADPEPQLRKLTDWMGLPPIENPAEFNVEGPIATAYAGDKKIVGTNRPHKDSIDAWEQVFTNEELQILLDAIGPEIFVQMGYQSVLDRLAERGVRASDSSVRNHIAATAETMLTERMADIADMSTPRPTVDETLKPGELPEDDPKSLPRETLEAELDKARKAARQGRIEFNEVHAELSVSQVHVAEQKDANKRLADAYGNLLIDRAQWVKTVKDIQAAIDEVTFKKLVMYTQRLILAWIVGRPAPAHKDPKPWPKITIVTPCFNSAATIWQTIESVRDQKYPNLEYIIVDGGSTDDTLKIVKAYTHDGAVTKVISEPDNGMYDAIRKGFAVATGEIFAYINADDYYEPGGLRRVGEYFRDHPRTHLIYHEDTVEMNGWKFANSRQVNCDTMDLMNGYMLFQDGVFWRRGLYDVIGGASSEYRYAGDYDLWLRMSRTATFVRRPGHVSCFRVRTGQLSENMEKYREEQTVIKEKFWSSLPAVARYRIYAKHWWTLTKNFFHLLKSRQMFFPMDLKNLPPPYHKPPKHMAAAMKCPLTGKAPDSLLFSTPDTRYGDEAMNYVYYCAESGVAMSYPPLSEEQLTALYEKHYSGALPEAVEPLHYEMSPYRKWFGGTRFDKFLRRNLLRKSWRERASWKDPTSSELLKLVKDRFPAHGKKLRFLDVGCFEGELLDQLRTLTDWQTCGLDPNAKAVEVARQKGHQIWEAAAADAPYIVPEDARFDIIYLGQTIEHLNDPVNVMRRLRMLLAPGGAIVLSTPNLESKQIQMFGPTWAHWHIPFHRFLFSRRSMKLLADKIEMNLDKCETKSNPYWSVMTLWLNKVGLAGSVPHGQAPPPVLCAEAVDMSIYAKYLLWNRRGRGDYMYAMLSPRSDAE